METLKEKFEQLVIAAPKDSIGNAVGMMKYITDLMQQAYELGKAENKAIIDVLVTENTQLQDTLKSQEELILFETNETIRLNEVIQSQQELLASMGETNKQMGKKLLAIQNIIIDNEYSSSEKTEQIRNILTPTIETLYKAEDKWISAETLPKEGGRYWCFITEINDLGKSSFQWNCYYDDRDKTFRDSHQIMNVTHWMPLPIPPQQ